MSDGYFYQALCYIFIFSFLLSYFCCQILSTILPFFLDWVSSFFIFNEFLISPKPFYKNTEKNFIARFIQRFFYEFTTNWCSGRWSTNPCTNFVAVWKVIQVKFIWYQFHKYTEWWLSSYVKVFNLDLRYIKLVCLFQNFWNLSLLTLRKKIIKKY